LEYDVTLQINPARYFCFFENLPKVRAILSWNSPPPPNDPTFTPVWGNVVEERIQIAPGFFFELYKVFEEAKVKLPDKLVVAQFESGCRGQSCLCVAFRISSSSRSADSILSQHNWQVAIFLGP